MNDEGRVLEENLPDVPHLQDPDRVAWRSIAIRELETELIVLDDGFQHRRLARDLDVVLLDALEPFGLGASLPAGSASRTGSIAPPRGCGRLVASRLVTAADRAAIRAEAERRAGPLTLGRSPACTARPRLMAKATRLRSTSSRASRSRLFAGSATRKDFAARLLPLVRRADRLPRLSRPSRLHGGGCRIARTLGRRAAGPISS